MGGLLDQETHRISHVQGFIDRKELFSIVKFTKFREPRHECRHVAEPQGGARVADRKTRVARLKRVNTPLTSRFSRVREVRARRHDVETR
jgi:hypothetical protein